MKSQEFFIFNYFDLGILRFSIGDLTSRKFEQPLTSLKMTLFSKNYGSNVTMMMSLTKTKFLKNFGER